MGSLIVIGFLVSFGIVVWSVYEIVVVGQGGQAARWIHVAISILIAVTACWTTYGIDYYLNENTRVYGWPIPVVVLQREDIDSNWADFVGPTVIFGLPMNFLIFMVLPSIGFLVAGRVYRYQKKRSILN